MQGFLFFRQTSKRSKTDIYNNMIRKKLFVQFKTFNVTHMPNADFKNIPIQFRTYISEKSVFLYFKIIVLIKNKQEPKQTKPNDKQVDIANHIFIYECLLFKL